MDLIQDESIQEGTENEGQNYDLKTVIECICPKCRKRQTMQLHWIGDFTPRKYCKHCRNHVD